MTSVQPVPCVLRVATRGASRRNSPSASTQDVDRFVPLGMAAFDQHGLCAEPPKGLGLRRHLALVPGLVASREAWPPREGSA